MYYFDGIENGVEFRDEEGRNMPDLASAHRVALEAIRDMMAAQVRRGRLTLDGRLLIRNDSGDYVMEVTYSEAVTLEG